MTNLPLALVLVLLGCSQDAPLPGPSDVQPAGQALVHSLRVEQAGELLAYAFDGRAAVPASGLVGDVELEYGEVGADAHTRLYRTFDGDGGEATVEGRFGQALALTPGVRFVPGTMALLERPVTVSFWLKQDPASAGKATRILEAGELSLRVTEEGYCRLRFGRKPPLGMMVGPLRVGEWNHVAFALDGPLLDQARLVVNDRFATAKLDPPLGIDADEELFFAGKGGFVGALDDLSIRGFATPTADLIDRWGQQAAAGEHVLELVRKEGTERVELWAGILSQPALTTGAELGSGELRRVVADPGGLRPVPAHWERTLAADPPLARTTHPTVYIGDNQVFLFGGETRDTHGWVWQNTDDTWIYHTDEGRWEAVESEEHPPPSCHQPAAFSPDHDLILYPGGWRNDCDPTIHYRGTWFFLTKERRWVKRPEKSGPEFPATSNIGLVYHPGERKFYAFIAGHARVMFYDPDRDRWGRLPDWEAVNEAGEPVDFRLHGSPMVGYDPEDQTILYFGGGQGAENQRVYSDETLRFDPKTNRFTRITTPDAPAPRVRSGFAYDSKRAYFVLYGGVLAHDSERFSDLWIFDPRTDRWREVEASNPPTPRGGYYGMAYDPDLDRFFLLCGRHSQGRFMDEVWSLDLDEHATGEATYVFDRSSFTESEWFAETKTPEDASVDFRFRATDELGTWGEWTDAPDADARFVLVQARLTPGSAGEVPMVTALGFR